MKYYECARCKGCTHLLPPPEIQIYGKLRAWCSVSIQQVERENKVVPGFSTEYSCGIHNEPNTCSKVLR